MHDQLEASESYRIARLRQPAQHREHDARDGSHLAEVAGELRRCGRVKVEQERARRGVTRDDELAYSRDADLARHRGFLRLVDELGDDILDSQHAHEFASLIDDPCVIDAARAELLERVVEPGLLGDEERVLVDTDKLNLGVARLGAQVSLGLQQTKDRLSVVVDQDAFGT